MFCAISVFWLVTAIMFITLVALCIAVPAALGLGFYQILKLFGYEFRRNISTNRLNTYYLMGSKFYLVNLYLEGWN